MYTYIYIIRNERKRDASEKRRSTLPVGFLPEDCYPTILFHPNSSWLSFGELRERDI